jgi:putative MATE family efflux protein
LVIKTMERASVSLKREAVVGRDWTKGSIIGNLWGLSWPMMVGSTLNMLGPVIDMVWVGKLGSAAVAGVGVSGMTVMAVNSILQGLFTGLRAMVARFVGAGDNERANHVVQQAFVVAAAFSIIMAVIGIALSERILLLFGVEPDVVAEGAAYMRIQFVGMVTMSLRMVTEASMQASGDSVTPMRIAILFRLLHLGLCPFLVFGWWVFPQLGVSGAATTNVIAQGVGGALGLWFLFGGRTRLRLTFKGFRFAPDLIWRLAKLGIPASVTGAERNVANLVLVSFVAPFGTFAVAAHSLMQRVDQFIQNPAQGLGQGAGVLAGQNIGAGQPERAARTGWLAVGLFTGVMILAAFPLWLWADSVVHIFNTEPGLVGIASAFLRINVVNYLLFGFAMVLMQCLNGAGDTMIPMLVVLASMWLVQVPLAYFLPGVAGLGVYGVRWAIVAGIAVRAVIYSIYFLRGRWKRKRV